jgi:hypothetical protein
MTAVAAKTAPTEAEEVAAGKIWQAKKLLKLVADLSNPQVRNDVNAVVDREALAVFADLVGGLLPDS